MTFDSFGDAKNAAVLLLKGRPAFKHFLIVAAGEDAPQDGLDACGWSDGNEGFVIRARDVVSGNWCIVARDDGSNT